jgi:NAD(P)H-dependent FMN reductase
MYKIAVIAASVRTGRKSDRVASFFINYIRENKIGEPLLLDLEQINFPLFHERLKFLKDPPASLVEFSDHIKSVDGIVIVTPEYNGGYPASLKNAIDVLEPEWKRKPIAIATVSAGAFGGMNMISSLQFSLWKLGACTVPAMFPVPTVEKTFDENGVPADKEGTEKRAAKFLGELQWYMDAAAKMK